MGQDSRRLWEEWVAANIGGDDVRRRNALDAALQSLAVGKSSTEAADAARRAVGAAAAGALRCRFCGSTPAVAMTIFEHNGYILVFTAKNLKGPFCRSCGLHAWRKMTDATLLRGWLGLLSFVVAPLTVLANFVNRRKLATLAAPEAGTGVQAPADPGRSLFERPGLYVYAAMIAAVFVFYVLPLVRG
ncbi:MAG: hypothetical protein E6I04_10250 [Chloroflexi bacterium]|nr:MAG: hypothetical protein E6I36_10155 [Chloroflexota bacterium]TMF96308.1 MAG: hypothetical protein E6I04_10250 [Chloroflexota bacterium]